MSNDNSVPETSYDSPDLKWMTEQKDQTHSCQTSLAVSLSDSSLGKLWSNPPPTHTVLMSQKCTIVCTKTLSNSKWILWRMAKWAVYLKFTLTHSTHWCDRQNNAGWNTVHHRTLCYKSLHSSHYIDNYQVVQEPMGCLKPRFHLTTSKCPRLCIGQSRNLPEQSLSALKCYRLSC